jgi:putative membrane protein
MKKLVLCIDRDDDLGIKTGIEGPVIGRHENVRAALALGLADPEDADTNTVLAAISLYDELTKKGENADVATITGDVNVGYQSDLELTRQLEEVLEVTGATSVILISNGAEDEYIFPMISSRTKVDSVRSVMVRQSKSVESTWYFFVKLLKDAKTRKRIIAPLGIILFAIGLIMLLPLFRSIAALDAQAIIDELSSNVVGIILFVMGLFLMQNAFRIRESFRGGFRRAKRSIYQGDVTIPLVLVTIILVLVGIVRGYETATRVLESSADESVIRPLLFLDGSFYWFVGAALVYESKRMMNALIQRESVPTAFWILAMFLIATAFLVLGGVHYMLLSIGYEEIPSELSIYTELGIGLAIAIGGAVMQRRLKSDIVVAKESWRR